MDHRQVEEHVADLRVAVSSLAVRAAEAGLEAEVPTAPAWTVRTLLAHQGMVHRWARATLRREDCHPPTWSAEGRAVADPIGWLQTGAADLVRTIESVPDDARARVFLADAPSPRLFWARRQCHETTIHAVDALAACLGRFPRAEEAEVSDVVALDGIDEILTGFVPRGTTRFEGVDPVQVWVEPVGHDRRWSTLIQDGGATTTRVTGTRDGGPGAEGQEVATGSARPTWSTVHLHGTAVGLYLALWNRTAADTVDDPAGFLTMWRERVRVRWR